MRSPGIRAMLQACLNGGRDKSFHAATPLTPSELAADARAVVEAGAQQLHIHSRDAVGRESLHPDDTARALEAIRASVPFRLASRPAGGLPRADVRGNSSSGHGRCCRTMCRSI